MPVSSPHSNASGTDLHEAKRTKAPVRAASTVNVSLSTPGSTIDGVTLSSGDRVLLKDQTTASQNGIYTWTGASAALTRSTDLATATDFQFGFLVYVREGTTNASSYWVFTQSAAMTVGTTSVTFVKLFVGAGLVDPTTTRGDLITRGVSAIQRFALGTVGQFLGSNGTDPLWGNSATYYATTGLTGATTPARFVGGTVTGAPTTGTFAVNDFVIDQAGRVWCCTGAGNPGSWVQSGGGMANPMTTNQDIIVGGSAGGPTRVGVGANGQVLGIVAGVISWINSASGFSNPMSSIGDIITGGIAGVAARLAIGANGQVLTVIGGQPGWANPTGGGGGGTSNNTASALYMSTNFI